MLRQYQWDLPSLTSDFTEYNMELAEERTISSAVLNIVKRYPYFCHVIEK